MGVLVAMLYMVIAGAIVAPIGALIYRVVFKDEEEVLKEDASVAPKTLSVYEYKNLPYSERRKYVRNTNQELPSVHDEIK